MTTLNQSAGRDLNSPSNPLIAENRRRKFSFLANLYHIQDWEGVNEDNILQAIIDVNLKMKNKSDLELCIKTFGYVAMAEEAKFYYKEQLLINKATVATTTAKVTVKAARLLDSDYLKETFRESDNQHKIPMKNHR